MRRLETSLSAHSPAFADSVPCWDWLLAQLRSQAEASQPPQALQPAAHTLISATGYQQRLEVAIESILLWTQAARSFEELPVGQSFPEWNDKGNVLSKILDFCLPISSTPEKLRSLKIGRHGSLVILYRHIYQSFSYLEYPPHVIGTFNRCLPGRRVSRAAVVDAEEAQVVSVKVAMVSAERQIGLTKLQATLSALSDLLQAASYQGDAYRFERIPKISHILGQRISSMLWNSLASLRTKRNIQISYCTVSAVQPDFHTHRRLSFLCQQEECFASSYHPLSSLQNGRQFWHNNWAAFGSCPEWWPRLSSA